MTAGRGIALATYRELPGLTDDDRVLLEVLRMRGAAALPVVWDAEVDWSRFDAVMIRSCWDSHLRRAEFVRWAERVAAAGVRLLNPAPMIAWNTDKRYLRDLEAAGVPVVPTAWVPLRGDGGAFASLEAILAERGWTEAVVKPAISAGAHETWRTSAATAGADQARFAALATGEHGALMVQPFVEEVVTEGEWSLVFIGGDYSHALRKRPAAGDFRVQPQYGGLTERLEAPDVLVAQARRVLEAAAGVTGLEPPDILYARVDGVVRGGRLELMELECVEPTLFFALAPHAADRVAALLG